MQGGDASSHTTRLGLGTHPRLFQIASTFPHSSRLALREVEEVKRRRGGGGVLFHSARRKMKWWGNERGRDGERRLVCDGRLFAVSFVVRGPTISIC